MARDSDFELYLDRFGPIDKISRRLLGGRNIHMALNGVAQRASRQFLRTVPPEVINFFLPPVSPAIEAETSLQMGYKRSTGFERQAYQIILNNTVLFRGKIFLLANDFFKSMWLRDCYFAAQFAKSSDLDLALLEQFKGWQRTNGQVPTEVYYPGTVRHYRDDESTLLFFLWEYQSGLKHEESMSQAWKYIKTHVQSGRYISPGGTRMSMMDALFFPPQSCIGLNHGLFTVAANLAVGLGLDTEETAEKAQQAYNNLAKTTTTCYLPISDTLPFLDPVSLLGEQLALDILGRSILNKAVVEKTFEELNRLAKRPYGFEAVTETGNSLPPEIFINNALGFKPQVSPLSTAIAEAVFQRHGLIDSGHQQMRLWQLAGIQWGEFTEIDDPTRVRHGRTGHTWNTYIVALINKAGESATVS